MFKQVFRSTFIALLFSLSISQSFATTGNLFKISSTGGAQVNITLCLNIQGQTPLSCQNYNTQAGTLTINTTIPDHTYYHAGIRINTPGFIYTPAQGLTSNKPLFSSAGFTLACPAGVSSSQTCSGALKSTASYTVGGVVTGLVVSGLVLQNNNADNLTISDNGSFTFATPVASGSPYAVTILTQPTEGTCTVTNGTGTVTANVTNINIQCHSTTAYIASQGNTSLYYCPVNPDSSLESCNPTSTNITFNEIFGVALNPSKSILYVTDWGNHEIYYCPIAEDGSTECIQTVNSIVNPDGIAINPTGTFAYIVDAINSIAYYCPVNPDGSLGACTSTALGTTPAFSFPVGIAINQAGTFAYIVDAIGRAYYCPVNPDGSLGACTSTALGTTPAFTQPFGIAINQAGTFAYIVDVINNIAYYCPVNPDGSLGACTSTAPGTTPSFSSPAGIAINQAGTFAYIVGATNSITYYCPVNPDGSLGACTSTAPGTTPAFSAPEGITL